MTRPEKVSAAHLERSAVVYVRQSTLAQVRQHTESTQRQYALVEEAQRLGWPGARVDVIDDDLGVSGRSTEGRSGFRELVGRVCVGEVGAILGLEVSRLARSSADLQRLLELARLTDTLVIDGDGIYDLADFNDRLLLGLKGTMSEAELHLLAGRLQGAKRAAAERGELRFPLPVGYVYDDEGLTLIDPDEQVQAAVADLFAAFEQTGSAYGAVGAFQNQGRRFPKRAYGGAWAGELRWGRLTHSRVLGVLSNPAYAGAYVYGRFRSRRLVDPDGTIRTSTTELPRAEWPVVIHDHHPGYIDWDTYLRNEARVARNRTNAGERPPREGEALLQGILLCGGCGRQMSTRYQSGHGYYECSKARADHIETPRCRSVRSDTLDQAVARRLLEALSPEQVALALAAADEVQQRRTRTTRAAELAVERSRYEADRADRAFHACEPEHRLVARSLEQRWEQKLATLAETEQALQQAQAAVAPLPPPAELEALCADLPGLWAAPTTSARDRKRLLRTLIADVTLITDPGAKQLQIGIRWHSGATEEHTVERPQTVNDAKRTPAAVIELMTRLGPDHTNEELLVELQAAGLRTGTGRPFDLKTVRWLRWRYEIPSPPKQLPQDGELTVNQIAQRLDISDGAIYYWISHGQLEARRGGANRLYIPFPPEVERACRERVANSIHIPTSTKMVTTGGAV
ncbi:MAG: recombinase family protein [Actinobacteria bacterium]|nr:recombinase family protein [Actinomycetota bacterium]MCA1697467.1 recombinase family protein [Actinomycetota bacterium]